MAADLKTKRTATRDRIMETAERLFSEYGYDGVSVRQIGAASNAQIALVHYYFDSKELLYRAVFENRIGPVSDSRRKALADALAGSSPPTIEAVLDALARPWIELRGTEQGRHYTRLIAREINDPREAERGIVAALLDPIAHEFLNAMAKALPRYPQAEIHWAYHFFIGTLLLVMSNSKRVARLSGDTFETLADDAVIQKMVGFVAHALRASDPSGPPTRAKQSRKKP